MGWCRCGNQRSTGELRLALGPAGGTRTRDLCIQKRNASASTRPWLLTFGCRVVFVCWNGRRESRLHDLIASQGFCFWTMSALCLLSPFEKLEARVSVLSSLRSVGLWPGPHWRRVACVLRPLSRGYRLRCGWCRGHTHFAAVLYCGWCCGRVLNVVLVVHVHGIRCKSGCCLINVIPVWLGSQQGFVSSLSGSTGWSA